MMMAWSCASRFPASQISPAMRPVCPPSSESRSAARPWRSALRLARALPRRVRGPVARAAFARGGVMGRLRQDCMTAVRALSDSQAKRIFCRRRFFLRPG
jgi:hypothetical protein